MHDFSWRSNDAKNRIFLLTPDDEEYSSFFERPDLRKYVSFLPLTETVLGITLDGFKYPLHNKDISILEDPSLCVSNEIPGERAKITFRKWDPDLRGVKRLKRTPRENISVKKQKRRMIYVAVCNVAARKTDWTV